MQKDPFNLIVTGVGGQGNVIASLLVGAMLIEQGYRVTIGETYGASQRGGSVMSHVRISRKQQLGPLMPPQEADLVIALEPSEAARVLGTFGNPETVSVVNTRPVQPVDVICGDIAYPDLQQLFEKIRSLSRKSYFVPATDKALELGNPILANIVLIGTVSGAGLLPLSVEGLQRAVTDYMSADKVPINTEAFLCGVSMVKN
jgi:indolepyruvate ferredoxin oxidoreductase, beta subunit